MSTVQEHLVTETTKKLGALIEQTEKQLKYLKAVNVEQIAAEKDEAGLVSAVDMIERIHNNAPMQTLVLMMLALMSGADLKELDKDE
jgi:hypothetical protein